MKFKQEDWVYYKGKPGQINQTLTGAYGIPIYKVYFPLENKVVEPINEEELKSMDTLSIIFHELNKISMHIDEMATFSTSEDILKQLIKCHINKLQVFVDNNIKTNEN